MHPSALLFLMVVATTGAAAIVRGQPATGTPAAQFWNKALPGSPMPEAIADLVQEGIDHSPLAEHATSSNSPSAFLNRYESSPSNWIRGYASSPSKFLNRYESSSSKFLNRYEESSSPSKFLNRYDESSPSKFLNRYDESSPSKFLNRYESSPSKFLNRYDESSPSKFLNRYESSPSKFLNRYDESSPSKFLNRYKSSPSKFLNRYDESSPSKFLNRYDESSPSKFLNRYTSSSSPSKFLNRYDESSSSKFLNRYEESSPSKFLNRYISSSSKFLNRYSRVGSPDNTAVPPPGLFFRQAELRVGMNMKVFFPPATVSPILPREVAEKAAFNNLTEVLTAFNIAPDSADAATLADTVHGCEVPATDGEKKACSVSLEGTVQSAMSMLAGTTRQVSYWAVASAIPRAGLPAQQYAIEKVMPLDGDRHVGCHDVPFPYAVYRCHMTGRPTKAYMVSLRGLQGGPTVAMAALCHLNTTKWSPAHPAFQILHTQPGGAPVCHFMPYANLVFGEKAAKKA